MNLAGLKIGHATHEMYHTGCTIILCPGEGAVAGVDVRGPAPGSRESALLGADKPDKFVNAVVLTGGSAFGLATADGVMRYLGERNIGHWTPIRRIPIVPAAVVYDLFLSESQTPTADMGYQACVNATHDGVAQGNVGAGAGVTVGKWAGFPHMMKGGFGLAELSHSQYGLVVMAAVVNNAVGDVLNADGTVLAGAYEGDSWLVEKHPYRFIDPSEQSVPLVVGANTTLVVVGTNAKLTRPDATRLAQRAHDGLAIAIRPSHTRHDGDTAFALAMGEVDAPENLVGNMAVAAVAEAVRNSVRYARTVGEVRGLAGG
ncbi:MAG: P1 family peptidase [Ardenticatenaceae bacterium]|nr:P1 family peptidase [Ardenticatenaceae bacterium]